MHAFPAWVGVVVVAAAMPLLVDGFERLVERRIRRRTLEVIRRAKSVSSPQASAPPVDGA